jgi:hypothetical protein
MKTKHQLHNIPTKARYVKIQERIPGFDRIALLMLRVLVLDFGKFLDLLYVRGQAFDG